MEVLLVLHNKRRMPAHEIPKLDVKVLLVLHNKRRMPAHEIPEQALEGVEDIVSVELDDERKVEALHVDVDVVSVQPAQEDGGEVAAEDHADHAEENNNSKGAHSP